MVKHRRLISLANGFSLSTSGPTEFSKQGSITHMISTVLMDIFLTNTNLKKLPSSWQNLDNNQAAVFYTVSVSENPKKGLP